MAWEPFLVVWITTLNCSRPLLLMNGDVRGGTGGEQAPLRIHSDSRVAALPRPRLGRCRLPRPF